VIGVSACSCFAVSFEMYGGIGSVGAMLASSVV